MRRGSVIGPLILILIGALFLMRNLWPEVPIADIISRYWPFLLIAWGGLRLIEILFLAIASKPIPRNGVSGGEWMLVFLICIVGATMYTARHYAGWFPTGHALRGIAINMGESYDYTLAPAENYYLIAYKNHSVYAALAYWVEDDTLHYVTTQNTHNQASLALIDIELTKNLNQARNVPFSVPGR